MTALDTDSKLREILQLLIRYFHSDRIGRKRRQIFGIPLSFASLTFCYNVKFYTSNKQAIVFEAYFAAIFYIIGLSCF
jgi:hypothetical protein